MDILLPIANLKLNILTILGIGFGGGLISGMLGLGSGVIITPALLFTGVPTFIANTTQLMNSTGTNLIGFISHAKRKDVDLALGFYIFAGGMVGIFLEYHIIQLFYSSQDPIAVVKIIGGVCLALLGILMILQAIFYIGFSHEKAFISMPHWMIYLPMHRIFLRTRAEISILVPFFVGLVTGLLTSTLGGGSNMLIVPIITYLIGRNSASVTGTSLMAAFFINLTAALIYGLGSAPADFVLLLLLFMGSFLGSRAGRLMANVTSRRILSIVGGVIVGGMGVKFLRDLYQLGGVKPSVVFQKGLIEYLNDLSHSLNASTPVINEYIIRYAIADPKEYAIVLLGTVVAMGIFLELIASRKVK